MACNNRINGSLFRFGNGCGCGCGNGFRNNNIFGFRNGCNGCGCKNGFTCGNGCEEKRENLYEEKRENRYDEKYENRYNEKRENGYDEKRENRYEERYNNRCGCQKTGTFVDYTPVYVNYTVTQSDYDVFGAPEKNRLYGKSESFGCGCKKH